MGDLRLHMASEPVTSVRGPRRAPADIHRHDKPDGLWYGFGPSWLEWCRSEQPDWIGQHWYEVVLAPEARILSLTTAYDVLMFGRQYAAPERYPGDTGAILWRELEATYDAIEINPYQWSMRLHDETSWYYSWDVASGCVWAPSLVTLREVEAPCSPHWTVVGNQ